MAAMWRLACCCLLAYCAGFVLATTDPLPTSQKSPLRNLKVGDSEKKQKPKGSSKKRASKGVEKETENSKDEEDHRSIDYDAGHACGRPDNHVVSVDYLVVGAGPGGLATAADLSAALRAVDDDDSSIAVVEKLDHAGGRYEGVDLVEPSGYEGPPLRFGLGALRHNPSTVPMTRQRMAEHGIVHYCSIFNYKMNARGRSVTCGLHNECHIFGNFCSNAPIFVNERNIDQKPYGAAFTGLTSVLYATGDPEAAAWNYLLGYEKVNPASGMECNNDSSDPKEQCPEKACKSALDWKSFLIETLGLEYAEFLAHAGIGCFGDQGLAFNACQMIEASQRDDNALAINCYPVGGMMTLAEQLYQEAKENGVRFYLEQPALCIDRSSLGKNVYEVRTPDYTFLVQEFLFIATSNIDIIRGMDGDLVREILTRPEIQAPKPNPVATVVFQWNPGEPAWFYDLIDKTGGSYSFSQFGDMDCFARMEVVDTPYHRQHNALRVVYTDFRCQDLWRELIEDAEASGDTSKLSARALEGLREAFPDLTVPEPVFVKGKYWGFGWYFYQPLSNVTSKDVEEFAVHPTDNPDDSFCLIGEPWAAILSGWSESAFVTSRNCLEGRMDGVLAAALGELFARRDAIVGDYEDTDPNFAAYPGEDTPGRAFPILPNEHFAPFGCLYAKDGGLLTEFRSGVNCGPPQCAAQGVPLGNRSLSTPQYNTTMQDLVTIN